ncbi:MFS transporter [Paraglaciecola hydrolytica]|uniref:MFS transporter n=1 Tax=Paraglaciecola hydrolytica TaxID=1799789 RepID=A0A148KKE2_9ALTE|nr:MFS transporter [Paraglaciecola hydrolytica]KXI26766.1 MFS transporter [Paraglaciecola hydrolytica]
MSDKLVDDLSPETDSGAITKQQWKWSALAGMASYLDAGSIVALGAGLALFQKQFGMSDGALGALAAIGPNALGCALGAFLGGWLGDKLGRKFIYQYDLLLYALGILCIAFAGSVEMLFAGTFIVGVAVGADIPTSLALVGELAPAKARGKLLGFTQVAWCLGPTIVLWLALAVAPLGMLGIRIVFLHLFVIAIITWALRRGLTESIRWKQAKSRTLSVAEKAKQSLGALFSGSNLKALIWTGTIYLFWNLAAGTAGAFNSYLITSHNADNQALGVGLPSVAFITAMLVAIFVFMPYSDRSHKTRKTLWAIGAILQISAYAMLIVLPFSIPVIIANIVLFAAGGALAGEAFYKVFSQELFPTMLRGTAQGFTFGLARVAVGVWSFYVPAIANQGIPTLATLLTIFLVISGGVGYFFMPNTSGKSLEQIEHERGNS